MMRRARDDRGGVAAYVVLLPMAFMLLFLVLQVALWFYGRTLVTYAAQHGLNAARVEQACGTDIAAGEAAGEQVVEQAFEEFGAAAELTSVEVDCGADFVTIDIEAVPPRLVSTWPIDGDIANIEVSLEAPVERVDP